MMGNLFYRGVQPSEIHKMCFGELCYWDEWHKVIEKGAERAATQAKAQVNGHK